MGLSIILIAAGIAGSIFVVQKIGDGLKKVGHTITRPFHHAKKS